MASMKDTEQYNKPIGAILFGFERDIPFTRLQQFDKAGIHKVYVLLSDQEFQKAHSDKYLIFDGDTPQTIIDYYRGYLPKNDAHIEFVIINTEDNASEHDKLTFFIDSNLSDNLLNLAFCKDKQLPWMGDQLKSDPTVLVANTTSLHAFNFELFKKSEFQLPSVDQRLSPKSADQLLKLDRSPILCYPKDDFDIVNYQALFRCFVEAFAVSLENQQSDEANQLKEQYEHLIDQYAKTTVRARKAEEAFESSHKKMYQKDTKPGAIIKEQHKLIVEERADAQEKAFPELIQKMILVYRDIQRLDSEKAMKKNR